ncbi:hypothetical protein ACFFMS_11030 [Ectobacillus funiculus]|uniref:Uncharacterized protein n=1 Tax=Ectobacillus funiculus TaxID=137993 RepID=A0ABV5WEG8_9BACI
MTNRTATYQYEGIILSSDNLVLQNYLIEERESMVSFDLRPYERMYMV